MSRILKRPMFRRGGKANEGIMSGLIDRTKLANGTNMIGNMTEDQFRVNLKNLMNIQDQFTPLPETRIPLGEIGFALASGAPVIDALGVGYKKFVSDDDKIRALRDKRKSAAVSTVLGQAIKTPKDARTAAIKNADELQKLGFFKTPEDKAKYIQAATIKGGGLNIDFNADGTIKSISEGTKKSTPNETKAMELKTTTFQMNNAGQNLIKNLGDAKVGAVGTVITALDSAGAQIKQAANSFGFSTTGPNKTYDEQGDAVDNYIKEKFGSSIGNDATKFAKIKSVSINLAYLMARIDEPGGRFTDRDIALKMEELGLGSDPERTVDVLTNALQLRNQNAAYAYQQLTNKPLDFSGMDLVGKVPEIGIVSDIEKDKETKPKDNDPFNIR
jgi:hypothetical protein